MSDQSKLIYSVTNDPTKWANQDFDVLQFATPADAKKAEAMFNEIVDSLSDVTEELKRLQQDSARYRWLRAHHESKGLSVGDELDAFIDDRLDAAGNESK